MYSRALRIVLSPPHATSLSKNCGRNSRPSTFASPPRQYAAEKLRAKLADFGISGEVVEIRPGPVVTMYEFLPGPGIKVSKIAALQDDLAMAMEAMRLPPPDRLTKVLSGGEHNRLNALAAVAAAPRLGMPMKE